MNNHPHERSHKETLLGLWSRENATLWELNIETPETTETVLSVGGSCLPWTTSNDDDLNGAVVPLIQFDVN